MCSYEDLLLDAERMGLKVFELDFESDASGLCYGEIIGIRKNLPSSEKACVLAEEIGHYKTTVGDILNQSTHNSRKQEKVARKWAIDKMLTIDDLFDAEVAGCKTLYDASEFLGVTEKFFLDALEVFKMRYGVSYEKNGKTIIFNDRGFSIIHK